VRERENVRQSSNILTAIANSTACRHPAITPILVEPIANEESTNRLPFPLRPVSWNRSSSLRRSGRCLSFAGAVSGTTGQRPWKALWQFPHWEITTGSACVSQGPAMKARNTIPTTDFEAFYERNEPDGAGELACLYRSVRDVSNETLFETKEVQNQGNVTHHVIAASGDMLILTARSYPAFIRFIVSKNSNPELDIEEAADFEYSINNPHS
jgi:hypothetical protein